MATNMKIPQRFFMFWSTAVVVPQLRLTNTFAEVFPVAFVLLTLAKTFW